MPGNKTVPLAPDPTPEREAKPQGIAADDAGATSMAERAARTASSEEISPEDKARLGTEASRDEDA